MLFRGERAELSHNTDQIHHTTQKWLLVSKDDMPTYVITAFYVQINARFQIYQRFCHKIHGRLPIT